MAGGCSGLGSVAVSWAVAWGGDLAWDLGWDLSPLPFPRPALPCVPQHP